MRICFSQFSTFNSQFSILNSTVGNIVKWIGAGIGWFAGEWLGERMGWEVGGPAGSLVGFILGTVIDSFEIRLFRKSNKQAAMGDFAMNLLMVVAAVLKAKVPITKQKMDNVKLFLKQHFGNKEASKALIQLNKLLKQKIPLENACEIVRYYLDYSSCLQLTHFLYNLANMGGSISDAEKSILNNINFGLKINTNEKRTIGSVFIKEDSIMKAYGILGVIPTASIIDIKKAYRALAAKYHPDKVAYLGEEMKKVANEKFQQLSRAYETIKKERKFT